MKMKNKMLIILTMAAGMAAAAASYSFAVSQESEVTDEYPDIPEPVVVSSGDYDYILGDDNTVTITGYSGSEEALEIPSQIDGHTVSAIGDEAFCYLELESLIIPENVQSIGQRAFEYCSISDSLSLPGNIVLGGRAFGYAEISSLTVPAGAKVGECAFNYCDELEQVFIERDAIIESRAFGYCDSLERVVCASGCLLQADSFEYCDDLTEAVLCGEVHVEEGAFNYCDRMEIIEAGESDFEDLIETKSESGGALTGLAALLIDLLGSEGEGAPKTEPIAEGEHRITLAGDTDVFIECPVSAKPGETVTVSTVDVADGEVKIKVNGSDIGTWENWGTYTFTMPDEDTEVYGWISTEGYPGA